MNCFQQKELSKLASESGVEFKLSPAQFPLYDYNETEQYELSPNLIKTKFFHDKSTQTQVNQYYWVNESCYLWKKKNNKTLVILHLESKTQIPSEHKLTILFNHCNTSTLGTLYSTLYDFATQFKCNVISYDYSGIGKSTGVFNEQEMYNDVEEMSAFIDEMNIPRNNIFVLGHSLGCLTSFHYTTTFKDCCGLVLVNLVSFEDLRKISNVKSKYNFNDLETKKLFQELHCPTFLIHAKEDEMELEENTNKLCKTLENCKSWFPNNCGHLNLFVNKRKAFISKVRDFLYMAAKNKGEGFKDQEKKKKNLEQSLAEGNKSTVEDDLIKKIDDIEIEKMRNGDGNEEKNGDSGHDSFVDEEEVERNMKMEKELEAEYQY